MSGAEIGGGLTYDRVGASLDTHLLTKPPTGYRPLERAAVVGWGEQRFDLASQAVLAWALQHGSGMQVVETGGVNAAPAAMGQRVRVLIPFWPITVTAPAEVVAVVDSPRERGFAYGTLPGHPERGEEAFLVRMDPDGTVRVVVRAFSRPASARWHAVKPVLRLTQEFYTRRYLAALRH